MTPSPSTAPDMPRRHGGGIFLALVPWVLFSFVVAHGTAWQASLLALLCSAFIAVPGVLAGRPKLLELGAVATFAAFAVIALALDPAAAETFARYARGIAALVLAAIAFGSLRFVPFTEQYARASVPQAAWSSPRFKAVNRRLTVLWGSVFAAMAPLHLIAGALDTPRTSLLCNWVIPVGLVLWAVERTGAVAGAPRTLTPISL